MTIPNEQLSREEEYLSAIAGTGTKPDRPLSRKEEYLDYIAEHGGGSVKAVKYIQVGLTGVTAGGYSVSIEYTASEIAAFQNDGYLVALRMSVPAGAGFPGGDYTLLVENASDSEMIAAGVIGATGIQQVFTVVQTAQTQNTGILFVMDFPQTIKAAGAPTTSTAGGDGSIYINTTNRDVYICVGNLNNEFLWKKVTTE